MRALSEAGPEEQRVPNAPPASSGNANRAGDDPAEPR
ncbi:hypothetical protein PSP6_330002 [Paraburkholderia tropica]|nr:hypothetical protein PSP6_330002 [Paraburkholderia tropica]